MGLNFVQTGIKFNYGSDQSQYTEHDPGLLSLGTKRVRKQKDGANVIKQGSMFQLLQASELRSFRNMSLTLE